MRIVLLGKLFKEGARQNAGLRKYYCHSFIKFFLLRHFTKRIIPADRLGYAVSENSVAPLLSRESAFVIVAHSLSVLEINLRLVPV